MTALPEYKRSEKIVRAIQAYAKAYAALDGLQSRESPKNDDRTRETPRPAECLMPRGDQKTGAIGEFYAIRYARMRWEDAEVVFGNHSQKGWDLKVSPESGDPVYIQVKTASAFGDGKLGKIPKPSRSKPKDDKRELPNHWDQLWVLHLDKQLQPNGFWAFEAADLDWTKQGDSSDSPRIKTGSLSGKQVPSRLSEGSHPWFKGTPECLVGELIAALASPADH